MPASFNFDEFAKSRKTPFPVIPVKTGIQEIQELLDSRLRGSDNCGDFLRIHQYSALQKTERRKTNEEKHEGFPVN